MSEKLTFNRDCGPDEWSALHKIFIKGETVSKYEGHTYGVVRDDKIYGNRNTIAVTIDGNTFFTCPIEFFEEKLPPSYLTSQEIKDIAKNG